MSILILTGFMLSGSALMDLLLNNDPNIFILMLASCHNGCSVKAALDNGLPLLLPNAAGEAAAVKCPAPRWEPKSSPGRGPHYDTAAPKRETGPGKVVPLLSCHFMAADDTL